MWRMTMRSITTITAAQEMGPEGSHFFSSSSCSVVGLASTVSLRAANSPKVVHWHST